MLMIENVKGSIPVTEDFSDIDYSGLPDYMRDQVWRWVNDGLMPDSRFLWAVIENDLRLALGLATHYERERLHFIVYWFWSNAPSKCWGQSYKARSWRLRHETTEAEQHEKLKKQAAKVARAAAAARKKPKTPGGATPRKQKGTKC